MVNNTDYIISKLNSRFYCLGTIKKFNVDICVLKLFRQLVIKSVFTYCCLLRWKHYDAGHKYKYRNKKKSDYITQSNEHSDFCVRYKNAIQRKLQAVLKDQSHTLHPEFHKHVIAISDRMRIQACSTIRYLKSFVPLAISVFNSVITRRTAIISH